MKLLQCILYGLTLGGLFTCITQVPTSPESTGNEIQLSLGRTGVYETEFTGTPIRAIVILNDSVAFNQIDWFTGAGQQILPDVSWNQKLDSVAVSLYWAGNIPQARDSIDDIPYDSIYVKVGLDRSNAVRVKVKNRAPIIDSIIIGDSSIAVKEKVYGEDVYAFELDSAGTITMRLLSYDFDYEDRNNLSVAWRSKDSSRIQYDRFAIAKGLFEASYQTPQTNFRDTIFAKIFDGRGGNTQVAVVLHRNNGPSAITVDSVKVGPSAVYSADSLIVHEVVSLDSIDIRAFSRSRDIQARWETADGSLTPLDSAGGLYSARFRCAASGCVDTLHADTTQLLGRIFLTFNDLVGGEKNIRIRLVKVPINKRPTIDSISLDNQTYSTNSMGLHKSVALLDTLELQAFFHDTDDVNNDELTGTWETNIGNIITISSTNARYTSLDYAYTDTITFTVEDKSGFKAKQDIALTVSFYPVIDSVSVNDKVLIPRKNDTLTYLATLQDTLELIVWARDPSGGIPKIDFVNKNKSMMSRSGSNAFRYLTFLPEADIDSTDIVVTGKDSLETKLPLILTIQNRHPVIDSIVIDGKVHKSTDPIYTYEATVLDSITLEAFVHDPDSEEVEMSWEVLNSSEDRLIISGEHRQAVYGCLDSLYRDTVRLTVRDELGGISEKRIVVLVNNTFPIIDSVSINDITFVSEGREDSLFFYQSIAPDTVAFESFAHDPDAGDEILPEWQFRDQDQKLRVFKDKPAIEYVSADSSYIDTVILRVIDSRNALDTKKIIMDFTR